MSDYSESSSEVEFARYDEVADCYRCCSCDVRAPFKRPNEVYSWRCSNCRHRKCEECGEVDSDGLSIIVSDNEDEDRYIINDPKAERVVAPKLERGPKSLKFLLPLIPAGHMKDYKKLPVEIESRIAAYVLLPGKRVISVRWSHLLKQWRYHGGTIPAAITTLKETSIPSVAKEHLKPAPGLLTTSSSSIPWFNYSTDILSFEYLRCGSRKQDLEEYLEAVEAAAAIVKHQSDTASVPSVRKIKISWCQQIEAFSQVLDEFQGIRGLQTLILDAHDHFREHNDYDDSRMSRERDAMTDAVSEDTLDGYTFKVHLFSETVNVKQQLKEDLDEDYEDADSDSEQFWEVHAV